MRFLRRFVRINFEIAILLLLPFIYIIFEILLYWHWVILHSALLFLPLVGKCPRLFQGKALQSKVDRIHHNQCLQSRGYG